MKDQNIELPPLVGTLGMLPDHQKTVIEAYGRACARTAIEAYRKRTAELLKNPVHVHTNMCRGIIAPITFDMLAHVLGEEATRAWLNGRQRRGEPVAWCVQGEQTSLYITGSGRPLLATINGHDPVVSITPLYAAPQPADPIPSNSGELGETAEPVKCLNPSMGEHACSNRDQCWEPCGELGSSIEHAKVAEPVELPVIEPNDLRIDTYRAEPHSAWIVKADTGVRVTHVPTGLSAACHEDRSVHRNRALAMEKLQKMLQTHEPVKVPSDEEIMDVFRAHCEDFRWPSSAIDGARALLARYGNQENSNG